MLSLFAILQHYELLYESPKEKQTNGSLTGMDPLTGLGLHLVGVYVIIGTHAAMTRRERACLKLVQSWQGIAYCVLRTAYCVLHTAYCCVKVALCWVVSM